MEVFDTFSKNIHSDPTTIIEYIFLLKSPTLALCSWRRLAIITFSTPSQQVWLLLVWSSCWNSVAVMFHASIFNCHRCLLACCKTAYACECRCHGAWRTRKELRKHSGCETWETHLYLGCNYYGHSNRRTENFVSWSDVGHFGQLKIDYYYLVLVLLAMKVAYDIHLCNSEWLLN